LQQRSLAVLCRVTDVLRAGSDHILEATEQRRDDPLGVIDAERRLSHVGDRRVFRQVQPIHVGFGLDEYYRTGDLPQCAFHLGVARVADQNDRAAVAQVVAALRVHFRHERAGGVEHPQATLGGLVLDLPRHAVRAEDRDRVRRHLGQFLNENGAARFERVDHPFVVNNLVAHVDRRAVFIECALDNFDCTHDSRAEAAGFRQDNLHPAAPLPCPFIALACRRRCARSARDAISAGCNSGVCRDPNTSKTLLTIPFASSPALAYMAGGLSWSMKMSGNTMLRTLNPRRSSACDSLRSCITWAANPPMAPSSIVISNSCSRAS